MIKLLDCFEEINEMIYKILMCLPISNFCHNLSVWRLLQIVMIIFYLYSLIAIEFFNTNTNQFVEGSPYELEYADFNSFSGSWFLLFNVIVESAWANLIYDNAYKFNNFYGSLLFFISFHIMVTIICISIIKGTFSIDQKGWFGRFFRFSTKKKRQGYLWSRKSQKWRIP